MEKYSDKKPAGVRSFVRRHWTTIRSWLMFAVTMGVWLIWYPIIVRSGVLNGLLTFNADVTCRMLRFLGRDTAVNGTTIASSSFTMRVGIECTAVVPAVILLCALVAYPARLTKKLVAVAIGVPALFVLNLVRLVTLYNIGVSAPRFFDVAHYMVWQSIMVIAVVAIWLCWVGKVANARPT